MKNFIFMVALFVALFAGGSRTASAQEDKRLNSAPQAFKTFFAKFKRAVESRQKLAVASMTEFPFNYGFDAGDEGTMTKTQFIKRFNEVFGNKPRDFMPEKNPYFNIDDDGTYIVSTEDASHWIFVKKGSSFKLSALMVEP